MLHHNLRLVFTKKNSLHSLPVSPQRFQIGVLRHDGKKQKCLGGTQSAGNFTPESRLAKGSPWFTLQLPHFFHDCLESQAIRI